MPIINQVVSGGGGSGPQYYIEYPVDANGVMSLPTSFIDLDGVLDISSRYAFYYAYYWNSNITNIDFKTVKKITGQDVFGNLNTQNQSLLSVDFGDIEELLNSSIFANAFYYCRNLSSINVDSIRIIGDKNNAGCQNIFSSTFRDCIALTTVDFKSLEEIYGIYEMQSAFSNCSGLTRVYMKKLRIARDNQCFSKTFDNSGIVTMSFESLVDISKSQTFKQCYQNCRSLTSLWFYALTPSSFGTFTNQFDDMFNSNVTGCTVHFPMAIQSTIGSWTSVTGGFGGTSTTVSFDIVTSLTGADGNTYTRSEKDSTSTATAWTYNDTLYYTLGVSNHTAGVNEPSVADTIYSDAACTTSVTTITAIA